MRAEKTPSIASQHEGSSDMAVHCRTHRQFIGGCAWLCRSLAKDGHYTIGADDRGDRNRAFYGEKYQRAMDSYETLRPGILPAIDQVRGQVNGLSNEFKLKPFLDEYFYDSINSLEDLFESERTPCGQRRIFRHTSSSTKLEHEREPTALIEVADASAQGSQRM